MPAFHCIIKLSGIAKTHMEMNHMTYILILMPYNIPCYRNNIIGVFKISKTSISSPLHIIKTESYRPLNHTGTLQNCSGIYTFFFRNRYQRFQHIITRLKCQFDYVRSISFVNPNILHILFPF